MPVLAEMSHTLISGRDVTVKRKSKKDEVLGLINGGLNIVLTIDTPSGPVHFADNYYASKTPEELEAIKRDFYAICWQVQKNIHERRLNGEKG